MEETSHQSTSEIDKVDALGAKDNQTFIATNFKYSTGNNLRLDSGIDEESSTTSLTQADVGDDETLQPLVEYHTIADEINEIINEEEPKDAEDEYNDDQSEQSGDQMSHNNDEGPVAPDPVVPNECEGEVPNRDNEEGDTDTMV